ncbi:RCC1 domain-containing protein [Enhygromyxa salina]|nr:hypothetical protein [Enhygromyxa salina]
MTFVHSLRPTLLSVGALACCSVFACAGGEIGGTFGTSDETMGDGDSGDGDGDTGDGDGDTGDGDGDGDGDEPCTSIGCECDDSDGSCDMGLACIEGICESATCGNGITEAPAEECDDLNDFEGDGCDNDCTYTEFLAVEAGASHTCALIESGRVRCWGLNNTGQLGYGNLDNIGDNEPASTPGDVVLGEKAVEISVGGAHSCAFLEDKTVRCWGEGELGQLGQGNAEDIGDDEFPFSVSPVSINAEVLSVHAGGSHTCALVGSGTVRCWGLNSSGQLGYGNVTNLTIPLTVDLSLDGTATAIAAGSNHNCALLDDGKVRCWGLNNRGQLGYGNTESIGDDETPASVVPVPILPQGIPDGTLITQIALGDEHSCVLYETGDLLCWGDNFHGQLGQGSTTTVGDNETLATLFPIDLGGDAQALTLGKQHTCALMSDGGVKCWGRNLYGQLGRGDIAHIGDDEVPADVSNIDLGGTATWISAGDYHTCAVVDRHEIVCWGFNDYGQLGYGDTLARGDDETPAQVGGIPLL